MRPKLLEQELGVRTMRDMLYCVPFRYIDRTQVYKIPQITEQENTSIRFRGRITGFGITGVGRKRRFSEYISDGSGSAEMVWFQGIKGIQSYLEVGREYLIFGRPSFFRSELSMIHPEVEPIGVVQSRLSNMQGVYSSTEKLSNAQLGTKGLYKIVCKLWEVVEKSIQETIPQHIIEQYGLISLHDALQNIHFPQSPELLRAAEYRLKFEELLGVQLNIQSRRANRIKRMNGFVLPNVGKVFNTFYKEKLPFELTGAQKRVIKEIRADMVTGYQMNRLLQGDVGSGKTLVALMSMLLAVDNGFQACMMAPTEILARQHYATFARLTEGLGIEVGILTGTTKTKERREILERVVSGEIKLLLGTHALLEERVLFENLGFVVIDEQHRFGVEQRAKMWTKNHQPPHILVMTATPIPRTLAMTLVGDSDVAIIHELPAERQPIATYHYDDSVGLELGGYIRKPIARGRPANVVYSLE